MLTTTLAVAALLCLLMGSFQSFGIVAAIAAVLLFPSLNTSLIALAVIFVCALIK